MYTATHPALSPNPHLLQQIVLFHKTTKIRTSSIFLPVAFSPLLMSSPALTGNIYNRIVKNKHEIVE